MQTTDRSTQSILLRLCPFLSWVRLVTPNSLLADFIAGLTGAVIVLPQGIAYALIAGLPPEYGLYTAMVTPIIAGLFGSSLHLISGPTIAISIVVLSVTSGVAEIGSPEFVSLALTITLLAGLIQLAFGLLRLGTLVNFISHTVVLGFTAGAAILIASNQLKYVFGVEIAKDSSFLETWVLLFDQLPQMHWLAFATAIITIVSTLSFKKLNPRLPVMLMGMVIGSGFCWVLDGQNQGIALVRALPEQLPAPTMPELSSGLFSTLLPGAFAIALLGLVEAVSIARSIAIKSGQRIDGNQEFIGQGLSNIVGSFFSCYAGSGSFTRSGANYDAGAKTPIAAIFAAFFVLLILLFIPHASAYLPMPVVGGAIILIAWNLIDFPHIRQIFQGSKHEVSILLVTFFATLLVELEFAIYVGVILSLALYLLKASKPVLMEVAPKNSDRGTYLRSVDRSNLKECPQLKIIRVDGAIFFGAVDYIESKLEYLKQQREAPYVLIYCPAISFIDVAGAEMLLRESKKLRSSGGRLCFCGMKNQLKEDLEAIGYIDKIGRDNFFSSPDEALTALIPELNKSICDGCETRVFNQCPKRKQ